jgi:hypothetical protein
MKVRSPEVSAANAPPSPCAVSLGNLVGDYPASLVDILVPFRRRTRYILTQWRIESLGPRRNMKVDRAKVAAVLAAILDRHKVLDMSVKDPPLDQMIARVFEGGKP